MASTTFTLPATGLSAPPLGAQAAPAQSPGMMNQSGDPLAALRDIHTPGMIESWPPAVGWWVLAAVLLIASIAAVIWVLRRWRANQYRREALAEMDLLLSQNKQDHQDREYLVALQQLLKRVALTKFPRESVAGLYGEAWLQFLDRSSNSHAFSIGPAEALIDGNYRPDINIDVAALDHCARQWITQHDPKYLLPDPDAAAPDSPRPSHYPEEQAS